MGGRGEDGDDAGFWGDVWGGGCYEGGRVFGVRGFETVGLRVSV